MARVLVRVYHFNSHLREETNKNSISPQQNKKIFQLTSPRGDKPDDKFCLMPYLSFQFTSPRGDELLSSLACAKTLQFQITFPCGNERILIVWSTVPENFNSRLRKETNSYTKYRQKYLSHFNSRLRKETNFNVPIATLLSIISTHISARRRTGSPLSGTTTPVYFNSRLPKETNRHVIFFNSFIDISTHVSARRRTLNKIIIG